MPRHNKLANQTLFIACLPLLITLAIVDWIAQRFDILNHKRFTPMPDSVGIKRMSVIYRSEGWLK